MIKTRFRFQLAALTFTRLLINTTVRMVYPFAPELGRGLNVPVNEIYRLITYRSLMGFLSPFFGPLSEKYGRKPILIGAVFLFSASCLLVVFLSSYWVLGVTLSLIAIVKLGYDPALQAYLGDTIPFHRRGKAVAVSEIAWAGAFLMGAPFVGWLIKIQDWRAPFLWLAILAIGGAIWLWVVLPSTTNRTQNAINLIDLWHFVRKHPIDWAAPRSPALITGASETFFIVYGEWMEASFRLSPAELGLATGIIGVSELLGEGAVGAFVDRFGKHFIVTMGLCCTVCYVIFPFTSESLIMAQVMLFVLFLFFEAMIVGTSPLMTELVPTARSLVITAVIAASSLGRAGGTVLGPFLYEQGDLIANSLAAATLTLIAMGILWKWLRVSN